MFELFPDYKKTIASWIGDAGTKELLTIAAARLATMERMGELNAEPNINFVLASYKHTELNRCEWSLRELMIESRGYRARKLQIIKVSKMLLSLNY